MVFFRALSSLLCVWASSIFVGEGKRERDSFLSYTMYSETPKSRTARETGPSTLKANY